MLVTLPRMVGNYRCEQLPPVVEAIEDLVGGGYWSYAPKRMAFLKWACLTYFGLKRAVLTHDVVQTTDTLEDDQPANQISAGASRGWGKYVLRDLCSYSMGIRNVIGTH